MRSNETSTARRRAEDQPAKGREKEWSEITGGQVRIRTEELTGTEKADMSITFQKVSPSGLPLSVQKGSMETGGEGNWGEGAKQRKYE